MEGARVECLVFVVGGDGNEELRLAVVHLGTQAVAICFVEVVGITRSSGVPHVPA